MRPPLTPEDDVQGYDIVFKESYTTPQVVIYVISTHYYYYYYYIYIYSALRVNIMQTHNKTMKASWTIDTK